MKAVQETVLNIIMLGREAGLPHSSKRLIMEEVRKTPLGETDIPNYSGTKSRLLCQVDQALYQLKKTGKIKKKGKGWTPVKPRKMYIAPICHHITKKDGRTYCPIIKHFIPQPEYHCSTVFKTIKTKKGWKQIKISRCPGYTSGKSTAESRRAAAKRIEIAESKESLRERRYGRDIRDPLSRKYMPKLVEHEKRRR